MTPGILSKVTEFCQKNSLLGSKENVVVAVSGGPDSLCLLHSFLNLNRNLQLSLTVAHVDHQLRGADSQADAEFVRQLARQWKLPFRLEAIDVANLALKRKQSIEETARQVRYAFLWRVALEAGATTVAVGHNADDQVETVLLHFLRGSGLKGLRGILPKIDISKLHLYPEDIPAQSTQPSVKIIRPLLEISRAEIEAYCQEYKLHPRQDTSNQDTTFYRNRLRHHLIPHLESYNPNLKHVLRRTAKVITAEAELLDGQVDKAWPRVVKYERVSHQAVRSKVVTDEVARPEVQSIEIDRQGWLSLPLALKRSVLRKAIQRLRHGLRDISFEHIEQAMDVLERGETGSKSTLPQGLMLTLDYQTFAISVDDPLHQAVDFSGPYLNSEQVVSLKLPGVTPLSVSGWQLEVELMSVGDLPGFDPKPKGRWEIYVDADRLGSDAVLRSRQAGDTFYPLGLAGHSQKVARFMVNQKIPVRWRNHIPLLMANNQIVWVCGYRLDERASVRDTTQRVFVLRFRRSMG